MPKYHVYGKVTGTKYLGEYEADNPNAAVDAALEKAGGICLCHQCSNEIDDPQIDDAEAEEAS